MLNTLFAKNVTDIFSNNNLNDTLKFDLCCKLVCELFDAHTASLFMYDAEKDDLGCHGNYIAPKNIQSTNNINEEKEIFYDLFQNILSYNFLNERRNYIYDDFISYFGITDSSDERKRFEEAKLKWIECLEKDKELSKSETEEQSIMKNRIRLFQKFNNLLHNERYEIIENETITGKFFFNLITNSSAEKYIIKEISNTGEQKNEEHFEIFKELGISILPLAFDNLMFVGLPLYANNRYLGILRITLQEEKIQNIEFDEQVSNISQILSLHIKSGLYLKMYQKLASLRIDQYPFPSSTDLEINEMLNDVMHILNCNGCLIKLQEEDEVYSFNGISNSLLSYAHYISNRENNFISSDLLNSFNETEAINGKEIIALNFSLPSDDSNLFETSEYYFENSKLKIILKTRKFKDIDQKYVQTLRTLKMHHFLVSKLDYFDNGFMVFTNTRNRPFTNEDIEIVLNITKRISHEITRIQYLRRKEQDMELQKKQSVDNATGEWMNVLVHQVGQVITSSYNVIQRMRLTNSNLFTKRNFDSNNYQIENPNSFLQNVKLLQYLIGRARSQINRSIILRDVVNNSSTGNNNNKRILDLWTHLKQICIEFDAYANIDKKIHIWLSNPKEKISFPLTTNENLLNEAIFCLLDNAVKYSFDANVIKSKYLKIIAFQEHSYNTEGHISISYTTTLNKIEISVTNWGSQFKAEEVDKIFENGYRGSNKHDSVGTGIGLYIVKKIMHLLNGEVSVHLYSRHKTTFKLILNK
jgi:signal transduction histidine kinase